MALRLLHRLRIFPAVFALPPGAGDRLSEDAFGGAACALAVEAFDEMQAWKHPEVGGCHRWKPLAKASAAAARRAVLASREASSRCHGLYNPHTHMRLALRSQCALMVPMC